MLMVSITLYELKSAKTHSHTSFKITKRNLCIFIHDFNGAQYELFDYIMFLSKHSQSYGKFIPHLPRGWMSQTISISIYSSVSALHEKWIPAELNACSSLRIKEEKTPNRI